MPRVEKSATVPARPEEVFDYVSVRENAPKFVPNLSVSDIRGPDGLGQKWAWEYRMIGVPVRGEAEMVRFDAPRSHTFTTTGMVPGAWTYAVAPDGGGSRVTVTIDYELPDTVLARIADKVAIHRTNESQVEKIVQNLHDIFAGPGRPGT